MHQGNEAALADLVKGAGKGGDPWAALAAKTPTHAGADGAPDAKLGAMLRRINELTTADGKKTTPLAAAATTPAAAMGAGPRRAARRIYPL